jgi:hypothetical protein
VIPELPQAQDAFGPGDPGVELRYLGFDQTQNKRMYKFDCTARGKSSLRFVVSVDMVLFLKYRVGIQEGPSLCARKLTTDFEAHHQGSHELTSDDLLAYTAEKAAVAARKAELRRPVPGRRKPETGQTSPWRR